MAPPHIGKNHIHVVTLVRRNGAYLGWYCGPGADDMTGIELFDAYSSLSQAKKLCRGEYFVTRWHEDDGVIRGYANKSAYPDEEYDPD